LAGEQGFEP